MAKSEKTHASIKKEIIDFLNSKGHFAWANQTGAYKRFGVWIAYGYKGSSDVFVLLKTGIFLCIEVKKGRDKLKKDQLDFANKIIKRGGFYIEARSLQDVKNFLKGR